MDQKFESFFPHLIAHTMKVLESDVSPLSIHFLEMLLIWHAMWYNAQAKSNLYYENIDVSLITN